MLMTNYWNISQEHLKKNLWPVAFFLIIEKFTLFSKDKTTHVSADAFLFLQCYFREALDFM